MEQGIYPNNLSFSENDELSKIAFNMNKMKEKIMDRELQLKNKLIELEKATLALKESQEKLEYDNLKNEFFANISHEFKTPLNILLSSLQLLDLYTRNDTIIDESDKLKHYMNGMRQNCYRLLRLINNLIDITKIDSSFFHFEVHNHDIVSIVDGIVHSTIEYAESKSITLNFHKHLNKKITACDPDIIERIILNLLSNAIKFTLEDGFIDVNIFEKENYIYLIVKDDGIGIPSDKLKLIFERFRQVDKSFTRNAEGSGIGLSLVKALVEMHNGSISVKSEYEEGSEFTVKIPVVVLDEEQYSSQVFFDDTKIKKMNVEFSDIYS
jgi:signal transduction histidine kinase